MIMAFFIERHESFEIAPQTNFKIQLFAPSPCKFPINEKARVVCFILLKVELRTCKQNTFLKNGH